MTVYERILTYPLQYGNLLDKYLKEMSDGDEKLLLLLQNVHGENIKNSFLINKFTSELALKLTVEVWKKLKLRESIGLDIAKSTRFAVKYLRTYLFLNDTSEKVYLDNPTESLSNINGAKSIGFDLEVKNIELKGITDTVPLPLELQQNPSGISSSEIQKELLDSLSDVAVQALETIAISTLKRVMSDKK